MAVSLQRKEEIKEVVFCILKKCNIKSIPICCFDLAEALGVLIKPYSILTDAEYKACLTLSEEGFTFDNIIFYNDYQLETRIRFTMMHEIGHIVLGHHEDNDITEVEANYFAANILVPPILVHAKDRTGDLTNRQIQEIFEVSEQMSAICFSNYKDWLNRITFGISDIDINIYNLFYAN